MTSPSEEDVRSLVLGQIVYLTGKFYTGRSLFQKRVLEENIMPPIDFAHENVFVHLGPVMKEVGGVYQVVSLIFLGHSQPFWAEIAPLDDPSPKGRHGYPTGLVREEGALPRLMRRHPNLHGDLSARSGFNAVNRDPEYGARFLEEFQDRLYFGTDIVRPGQHTPLVDYLTGEIQPLNESERVFLQAIFL
ncbi:MAG TPA: hypothetical protein GXX29_04080 [Firmicutes bacterium]|nr:hypothetical protein [Bacillota bacterium]